jgi:hypothetical protein
VMERALRSRGTNDNGAPFSFHDKSAAHAKPEATVPQASRNERKRTMWKTAALTLFAATLLAGTINSASAQYRHGYGYGGGYGVACPSLQRNGNLNPNLPPDWVFDPLTQKWLAPNTPQAAAACGHQQEFNAQQQYGYNNYDRRDYNRYGYNNGYGYGYGRR